MSAEQLATHALGRFLSDVLRPLRQRLSQAVKDGCDWRVRWARSEAAEAQRFLLLGRTLGLYPSDLAERLLQSQSELWQQGEQAVAAWTPTLQAQWQATHALLQGHTLGAAFGLEDEAPRRARARAVALLQSNLLVSSRLGHGLAAEALALLSFGHAENCLRALRAVQLAPEAPPPQVEDQRRRLMAALDDPTAQPPASQDPHLGVALVASVFHALQYTRALGYMHEDRDMLVTGGLAPPDALLELLGSHTGDLLHQTQYWRLNLMDTQFEQNLSEALALASQALFKLDPVVAYAQAQDGAQAFADDVLQRWRTTTSVWVSIHLAPAVVAVVAATDGRQLPGTSSVSF